MFKEVDVVFLIEHKDRELDAIKMVSKILNERYNLSVLILPLQFSLFYLLFYKPKIIVSYFIDSQKIHPIGILRNIFPKTLFVSMNWEQLISKINEEYKKPKDKFAKIEVIHIAWNEDFAKFLEEKGVLKTNIHVTGNVNDLILHNYINDNYNSIYNNLDKEFNISSYEKIIFIPFNLAWAFFEKKHLEFRISNGYNENIAKEHFTLAQMYLKELLPWIEVASKQNKNYLFIIRPHPSVSIEQYYSKFKELNLNIGSNIIISRYKTIKEWVTVSDAVYSNWSTVVYDSIAVGKTAYLLAPFPRPDWLNVPWNDKVVNLKTIDDFRVTLEEITNNKTVSNKKLLKSYDVNVAKVIYSNILEIEPIKKFNIKFIHILVKQLIKNLLCKYFKCYKVPKIIQYDFFDVIKYEKTKH